MREGHEILKEERNILYSCVVYWKPNVNKQDMVRESDMKQRKVIFRECEIYDRERCDYFNIQK